MRTLILFLGAALAALGQTATPPVGGFPSIPMPMGIVATGNYNQLGSPRFTGGIGAIYPISGSLGLYGVTGCEFYPRLSKDPTTGKSFYALDSNVQQEIHKDLLDTGKFSFLLGVGGGPALTSTQASGLTVNLSADGAGTVIYQASPAISGVFSLRGLFITGVGWNVIPRIGLIVNLKNLPKAKPLSSAAPTVGQMRAVLHRLGIQ